MAVNLPSWRARRGNLTHYGTDYKRSQSGVQGVDLAGEVLHDDVPLQLQRRGQVAVLRAELRVEDPELPHGLRLRDGQVALVDRLLDLREQVGVGRQVAHGRGLVL